MNTQTLQTISEIKSWANTSPQPFQCIVAIQKISSKTARNGSEFLAVEFKDKTDSFTSFCFNSTNSYAFFKNSKIGEIVELSGITEYYQDRFSPKITLAETLTEEKLNSEVIEQITECSPENMDSLWEELNSYISEIENNAIRETVKNAMEEIGDQFKLSSAAITMHHAYKSGLLEHTVHLARACKALLPLYPEIDPSLAMAGIILHDTGKVIEYEGNLVTKKSRTGILQGHVVLGYRITRKAAIKAKLDEDLLERLEHIILSHQGELEWGAAVMAATPEAVFVSMLDNLDAKMGMVQQALRKRKDDELFSSYIPGLKSPILTEPIASKVEDLS